MNAEREEAQAEAEAALVKEWMADHKAVQEAIEQMMCEDSLKVHIDLADIVTSHEDDKHDKLLRFLENLEGAIQSEFEKLAPEALEEKRLQELKDKGETEAMDREDEV